MKIKEYYYQNFRNDFYKFNSKFDEDWMEYSIMFRDWDYNHINKITNNNSSYFIHCLFYTVLIDQVIYTFFRNEYSKFEKITKYPKYMGVLAGNYNYNPFKIYEQAERNNFDKIILINSFSNEIVNFIYRDIFDSFPLSLNDTVVNIEPKDVVNSIINDSDLNYGDFGKIFKEQLIELHV